MLAVASVALLGSAPAPKVAVKVFEEAL